MILVLLVRFANRTRGLTGHWEELCCSSTVALPSICVKVTKNGNALLFHRQFCKKNWRVFIELGPGKETRQCLFGLKRKHLISDEIFFAIYLNSSWRSLTVKNIYGI